MPLSSFTTSPTFARPSKTARLGNWELLRKIHSGACFDVFLARPCGSHQCADYVVKILHEHLHDDPIALSLLANEVEASQATQHPHLTTIFECVGSRRTSRNEAKADDAGGSRAHGLILPRLEGVTLDVLHREGQCSGRRALRTVRQTAEALAAMHAAGWRHGDVKPANIMVSPVGHATLIDLSLAAPFHSPVRGGTLPYTAPEAQRGQAGSAGDVYSLGVVLCELLTGEVSLSGLNHAAGRVWPRGAVKLLRRMLQDDPNDRPHAAQVVDELTPLEIQCFQAAAI